MVDPLDAVSPLDGRYAEATAPLRRFSSEGALARARVQVEVEYLLAVTALEAVPVSIDPGTRTSLRELYQDWDRAAAERVKQIEVDGSGDRPPTHHDVKAVEYYVRERVPEPARPWVHFGVTSEDVNNLARRLLVRGALREVVVPALTELRSALAGLARSGRDTPMLARTHGQAASPTTFGKEMAVFATRLGRAMGDLDAADAALQGKLAGATGTYAAHEVALPSVDWPAFAAAFVEDLGFDHVDPVTQVHPGDDLVRVFHALQRVNGVLLDAARDGWQYVSDGYIRPTDVEGVGSSTMPQKVNPIDFENAEGNLSKATADLAFLGRSIQTSRLQRDLSDSTVKRGIGAAFAHCLLGYTRLRDGFAGVEPAPSVMAADLEAHPEVLAEAIQTVLRREGMADAYERVAAATQGQRVDLEALHALIEDLDIPADTREQLVALTPATYVGVAPELADLADEDG